MANYPFTTWFVRTNISEIFNTSVMSRNWFQNEEIKKKLDLNQNAVFLSISSILLKCCSFYLSSTKTKELMLMCSFWQDFWTFNWDKRHNEEDVDITTLFLWKYFRHANTLTFEISKNWQRSNLNYLINLFEYRYLHISSIRCTVLYFFVQKWSRIFVFTYYFTNLIKPIAWYFYR